MNVDGMTARRVAARIMVLVAMLVAVASPARAQLRLDITEGVKDAVPVAVVPFGGQPAGGTDDVAAVVSGDLKLSGRFAPLDRQDMVTRPTSGGQVRFEDWRLLKADYIVVGSLDTGGGAVSFELFNVQTGQQLLAQTIPVAGQNLRAVAHRISDLVFERLTGIPGAFSTRIAYISVEGKPPTQRYRLLVSDADGYNPRTVAESADPLMSPCWSPDGQSLAYVSFETKASAVYVQRLATGERRRVSARAGINGAPAFSPDGARLALTLSRGSNLDIYVLDLGSQALTRITSNDAIDTEAAWNSRRQVAVFHVRPGGQSADLPRRPGDAVRGPAGDLYQRLQRATKGVPGRQVACDGDPGPRLPDRTDGPCRSHAEDAHQWPAGRITQLCPERRGDHLRDVGSRARFARNGLQRRALPGTPERVAGRRARTRLVAVSPALMIAYHDCGKRRALSCGPHRSAIQA